MKNKHFFIIRVVIKIYLVIIRNATTIKIIYIIINRGKPWGLPSLGKDDIAAALDPSMQLLKSFPELVHYQNRLTALLQI